MSETLSNREAGYTLIELLVVMLLLGFIALGIGGGLHFGTRVWEASEQRISSSIEVVRAQTILRAVLGAALPRKEGGFVTFEGMPSHIAFDTISLPAFGLPGVARVEIDLVYANGGKQLRLRASQAGDAGTRREAVLADNIGAVDFAFLDAASAVPAWLASWRDRKRLPDAVRLAGITANQRVDWPYFVARLPIAQTAHCAFDPVSFSCREEQ